jgi:ketosteroid isomerase-like protein
VGVSKENVEIVRQGFEEFAATGEFAAELSADDFVWDMSHFHGWPEQQVYEGREGVEAFLREWVDSWDDWDMELEALHDAGERVVALTHQRGTAKASGMPVEMAFAQVWTVRDGKRARMDMYSDRSEAFAAAGLRD